MTRRGLPTMDLTKLPLFETMRARMSYLTSRQTVLSGNIANANTPGYRAQDITAPDFDAMTGDGSLQMTQVAFNQPGHIEIQSAGFNNGLEATDTPDTESTPDGNSVVLEDQMMKVSSNQMDYSAVTGLYSKALSLLRLAAGVQK